MEAETGTWAGMLAGGICSHSHRGGRGLWVWVTMMWPREWNNHLTGNGVVTPALTRVSQHCKENGSHTFNYCCFLSLACSYQCTCGISTKSTQFLHYWNQETGCLFCGNLFLTFHIFGILSGHAVSNTLRQDWFIEWVRGSVPRGIRFSGGLQSLRLHSLRTSAPHTVLTSSTSHHTDQWQRIVSIIMKRTNLI